jgi:hypothetical protein
MTNEIIKSKHNVIHQLASPIVWIVSRTVLFIIFLIVFMPIGLLMRLLDRDPLSRKLDPGANSYYRPSKVRAPDHMDKPY